MKEQFYKIEIICEWDNEKKITLGNLMAKGKEPLSIDITPIDIETDQFNENLNGLSNNYQIDSINLNLFQPFLNYSRSFLHGDNETKIGFELKKPIYDEDLYFMNIKYTY